MVFYRNSWSLTPPLWVFPKEKTQSSVQLGTAQSRFTQLFPPRILPARPRPPESSTAQACRQIDLESQFTTYPHCPGGVKRWAVAHAHRCPSTVCLISILHPDHCSFLVSLSPALSHLQTVHSHLLHHLISIATTTTPMISLFEPKQHLS